MHGMSMLTRYLDGGSWSSNSETVAFWSVQIQALVIAGYIDLQMLDSVSRSLHALSR